MVQGVVIIYAPEPVLDNRLWDFCTRRGWQNDDLRPVNDLQELLRIVRTGRVAAVLCSGLRGLGKSLHGLAETCHELGERLVIPSLGIVDAGSRKLLLRMIDAARESSAVMARESTNRGLGRARRRGVRLGRSRTIDAHRADIVRLRRGGMSGREIARELGVPASSVFNELRRIKQESRKLNA